MRVVLHVVWSVAYAAIMCFEVGAAFCPPLRRTTASLFQSTFLQHPKSTTPHGNSPRMHDTKLRDRLWERLEIEEDDEPMWYLLNCVAGLEMELLYQCREACQHMIGDDVVKFIVPTEKKTRSHGAKRMVTEHKVKYLGYVFAKLRLCKATYERIQSLDLCRSWMGTVNHKGYRKLPPSPLALNEDEIARFGLEEWVDEDDDTAHNRESSNSDDAILDSGEEDDDNTTPKVDTEAIKSFLGLNVNDMVKVTARNKFFNEEGVIRRLKDGKIMVRFLTYGTMFEEWLDPSDVRKLTDLEALRGLSGPTQPITQRDLDGPARGRDSFDASSNADFHRQQLRQGPDRNRRQDRMADRFSAGGSVAEQQSNDRNWKWYQEQQQQQKQQKVANQQPSWTAGSGASSSDKADKDWAMGDVDSQWGRRPVPPRQQRRNERTPNNNEKRKVTSNSEEDWSAFVSSATTTTSPDSSEDDFFASLMSDLKKDLKNADKSGEKSSSILGESQEDSLFFDSLLLDQPDAGKTSTQQSSNARNDNAVYNTNNKRARATTPNFGESQEDTLFFDSLLDELDAADDTSKNNNDNKASEKSTQPESRNEDDDDDFFAALEAELEGSDGDSSDFFAQFDSELSSNDSNNNKRPKKAPKVDAFDTTTTVADTPVSCQSSSSQFSSSRKKGTPTATTLGRSTADPSRLSQCTVPVLKEMLRERGMKLSGTKAELIDRLIQGS